MLGATLRERLGGLRPAAEPTVRIAPPPPGPGPWSIGRSDACRMVIGHASVSRRHALVRHVDDGLEVCDLGSLNGTWVNGWRVDRTTLRPGDTLRLGEVRVVLDPAGR
jgi:pSer/pThr/pTyr-binding forkhead associated (FHA) protein